MPEFDPMTARPYSTGVRRVAQGRQVEPFGSEFRTLFEVAHSIFRRENPRHYAVDYESGALQRFLAGEPAGEDDKEMRWYFDLLRRIRAKGGAMQCVHIVTGPLSDYLRFEFTVYDQTAAARSRRELGEVRYLLRALNPKGSR
jgi:hypothetical protein